MADGVLKTETILDQLVAGKREELERQRALKPLAAVRQEAAAAPAPQPFVQALRGQQVRLIAECKRSSPTAGVLDQAFEPASRALTYAEGGAAAVSVLTEERRFGGSLADISSVRAAFDAGSVRRVPLLRKDFLFDPYQLYEAVPAGADAVLLIVSVLEQSALVDLLALAKDLSLGVLVEVHNEQEGERAVAAGAEVIGINNRDLRTFVTSLSVTERLLPLLPAGCTIVSESGIQHPEEVDRLGSLGVDAVLIGEALMRSPDVRAGVASFTTSRRIDRSPAQAVAR